MKKIMFCGMCILLSGCSTIFDALTPYQEPKTRCKYDNATPISQIGLDADLTASLSDDDKALDTNSYANLDVEIGTPIDVILYETPKPLTLRGRYETAP